MKHVRRQINVTPKVLDQTAGLVEYVASDESLDSYREIIRVAGWRFGRFQKNAPFVDSHRYDDIAHLLGQVVDVEIRDGKLVETVQWAIDVPTNLRARIGWDMTRAGYLKAVSVGFVPTRLVTKWDADRTMWLQQLKELGIHEESGVRVIYVEQEQIELSAVIIGANPNALLQVGKAYKAGVIDDADLQFLSGDVARNPASAASVPGQAADEARAQAQQRFLRQIETITKTL